MYVVIRTDIDYGGCACSGDTKSVYSVHKTRDGAIKCIKESINPKGFMEPLTDQELKNLEKWGQTRNYETEEYELEE